MQHNNKVRRKYIVFQESNTERRETEWRGEQHEDKRRKSKTSFFSLTKPHLQTVSQCSRPRRRRVSSLETAFSWRVNKGINIAMLEGYNLTPGQQPVGKQVN